MARVTVEDCVVKVPNRFELVLLAAQRAREITSGAPLSLDRDDDKNPVVALREIADETIHLDHLQEVLVRGMQKHVEMDEPEEAPELEQTLFGVADPIGPVVSEDEIDGEAVEEELEEDLFTVADTVATLEDIERQFGPEIGRLVDGVTKLSRIELQSDQTQQAENFRKLVLAMSEDIRVLLVKLADRLHNMQTLRFLKDADKRSVCMLCRRSEIGRAHV